MKFRLLNANEIECRVGQVYEKTATFTLLLYKDARCDMSILDETVGEDNWQRDHKEIKGNLFGGVSIWDDSKKQWITKWDCGTESNTEKEKGEASDSFKRACVNWGIGRELYTSPVIRIKDRLKTYNGKLVPDFWKMSVKEIGYNDNREITRLVIVGDDEIIFDYTAKTPKSAPQSTKPQSVENHSPVYETAVKKAQDDFDSLKTALNFGVQGRNGVKRFCEMTTTEREACLKTTNATVQEMALRVENGIASGKVVVNDDTGLLEIVPF